MHGEGDWGERGKCIKKQRGEICVAKEWGAGQKIWEHEMGQHSSKKFHHSNLKEMGLGTMEKHVQQTLEEDVDDASGAVDVVAKTLAGWDHAIVGEIQLGWHFPPP